MPPQNSPTGLLAQHDFGGHNIINEDDEKSAAQSGLDNKTIDEDKVKGTKQRLKRR